jgi:hypothetical protein
MRLTILAFMVTISTASAQEQHDPTAKNKTSIDASNWFTAVGHPIAPLDKAGVADVVLSSVGKYEPLTLWSKIALGSSYFTDPNASKDISIVYAYNTNDFNYDEYTRLLSGIKDGKIQIGVINGFEKDPAGSNSTAKFDRGIDNDITISNAMYISRFVVDELLASTVNNKDQGLQSFVDNLKGKKSIVLLSSKQNLLDMDPKGTFYDTKRWKVEKDW